MTNKKEIKGLLGQVKQAATQIKESVFDLDNRIDDLHQKRSELLDMQLSKEDFLNGIRADIRARAGGFGSYLAQEIKKGGGITFPKLTAGNPFHFRYLDAGLSNYSFEMTERAYYFYFEDLIVAGVERAMGGQKWSYTEMPASSRIEALKGIDDQIEALTNERDSLVLDLVECGLVK